MGFLRTLLMWLLVLAVPAQGASAATMAFCGPGHHGAAQALHDGGPDSANAHSHHADGIDANHGHQRADAEEAASSGGPASGKVIVTDAHGRTNVSNVYAAGDVVRALDQIAVAVGHAAIAATAIHNSL